MERVAAPVAAHELVCSLTHEHGPQPPGVDAREVVGDRQRAVIVDDARDVADPIDVLQPQRPEVRAHELVVGPRRQEPHQRAGLARVLVGLRWIVRIAQGLAVERLPVLPRGEDRHDR